MSAVAFCASTYMTLAVTIERYIAVCRPHQYRTISQVIICSNLTKAKGGKKGLRGERSHSPPLPSVFLCSLTFFDFFNHYTF